MERPVHKPVHFTRVLVAAGFKVGVSSPGDLWEWREWCGLGCWQWRGKKQSELPNAGPFKALLPCAKTSEWAAYDQGSGAVGLVCKSLQAV